jgi:hypothetical protein
VENWFQTVAEPLLAAGKIKPHPVKVMPGGLNGVTAGWDLYRQGKISGEKLVYRIGGSLQFRRARCMLTRMQLIHKSFRLKGSPWRPAWTARWVIGS